MLFVDEQNNGSVDDFIAFREAVAFLQTDLPFSRHFGDVLERDHNDESVYVVYNRLCHDQNGLPFHCLCNCPRSSVGAFENNRMRRLRHLFQPNDDGIVTMQSFLSVRGFPRSLTSDYRYMYAHVLVTVTAGVRVHIQGTAKCIGKASECLFY